VNAGRGGDHHDTGLEALQRHYPRWRIWRGTTTGGYWALPPPDHPTVRHLIGASDLGELARLLAQAQGCRRAWRWTAAERGSSHLARAAAMDGERADFADLALIAV
jgi:hypothetical protein